MRGKRGRERGRREKKERARERRETENVIWREKEKENGKKQKVRSSE